MSRDNLRLAREAGCTIYEANVRGDFLDRFAALVAATERERILDVLLEMHKNAQGQHNFYLHTVVHLRSLGEQK